MSCLSVPYGFVGEAVSFWVSAFPALSLLNPFRGIQFRCNVCRQYDYVRCRGYTEEWGPSSLFALESESLSWRILESRPQGPVSARILSRALVSSSFSHPVYTKAWPRDAWVRLTFWSSLVNSSAGFHKINREGASLVEQWLRIRPPMQGTRVRALVQEDPTCRGATKPVCHNTEAREPQLLKPAHLEPMLHNKRSHRNEKRAHRNEE